MRRHAAILLLLFAGVLTARPEPGAAARFVNYSAADGLPSNTVYAIAQDADGVLWIGTRNGLARFDGARFRFWKEYGRVNALTVDGENRLWVGTAEGLTVMPDQVGHDSIAGGHDVADGRDAAVIAGPDRQSYGLIRALHTDSEGFVWATVGDTLLLKLSYRDGIREEARCFYDKRDSEGDYPYYQIYEASDGRLWLAGRIVRNQYVADRRNPHITRTHWEGMFCNGSYAESGGTLYAFEDHTSLLFACGDDTPVPLGRLPIAHARLLTDRSGRMWAAGSYGLGIVDTAHPENTQVFRHAADDPASLSSGELYCLFEDRQGNLWTGGDNGLSVLSPALQQVEVVSTAQVSALMEDHTGKLWIGTAEARVSALYEDRAGTVYVGLWNNTGWEVWKEGKMVHKDRLTGPLPDAQTEARHLDGANWISDFLEDSQGRFWVVTWEGVGLNEWDRQSRRSLPPNWLSPFRYPSPEADSNIYVTSRLGSRLIEDMAGNLVFATTQAGLNIIDRETGLVTQYYKGNSSLPDDYVTDLCLTPDGTLWAATRAGLWSPSGEHFLDGMLVQSVEADARGRLWAGTEDGLWFVDTDGSTGRVPKELGFPSDIYGERVSCRRKDGSLVFGGAAGAAAFHPDSLLSIQAEGNLPLERLIRHRYRLNNGAWREGRFTGLPENTRPGRYLLQEERSDLFGRWNRGEIREERLRVPQPLALRWPFLMLYALLLSALVWTVLRLRERRLLVKELEMRNRLFSIISHDLRNPVSGNRMLARQLLDQLDALPPEQLKEGLQALSDSTEETASLLENLLLWSLDQKGMLQPVLREENLAALAAEAAGSIHKHELIEIDIPSELTARTDRNMLLTCLRNLLENAVKVTPPGEKVRVSARGRQLVITDRGPGIRENSTAWGHGLGLVITRDLLQKMSASMTPRNLPEGGLEITLDL